MLSIKPTFFTHKTDKKQSSLLVLPPNNTFISNFNKQSDLYIIEGCVIMYDSIILETGTYISIKNFEITNNTNENAMIFIYEEPKRHDGLEIILKKSDQKWHTNSINGLKQTILRNVDHSLYLVSFAKGTKIPFHRHKKGEEIFVLQGELWNQSSSLKEGEWIRMLPNIGHAPYAKRETLILLRNGHL